MKVFNIHPKSSYCLSALETISWTVQWKLSAGIHNKLLTTKTAPLWSIFFFSDGGYNVCISTKTHKCQIIRKIFGINCGPGPNLEICWISLNMTANELQIKAAALKFLKMKPSAGSVHTDESNDFTSHPNWNRSFR